jgi:hypothetical protein
MTISIDDYNITYNDNSVENSARSGMRAIFLYGRSTVGGSPLGIANLVSNFGNIFSDISFGGNAVQSGAASTYGGDRCISGFGYFTSSSTNVSTRVSELGALLGTNTGVGTARNGLAGAGYGDGLGIFAYGYNGSNLSLKNLVSQIGIVATDVTGVGTARFSLAAATYGGDKAIFGYGTTSVGGNPAVSMTNLVSNAGVVATDTTGVGTARHVLAAAGYGGDKAIFGYGATTASLSMTNLVSNAGVVATDTTGVGTIRSALAAATYGGDKAIFGYGSNWLTSAMYSITNLVSNVGVVATDTTGVGTAREYLVASSFGP